MKKLIFLVLAGLLVSGCATQDVPEQGGAAVEQRDLLESKRKAEEEEARRRTQATEQEEMNRKLDEERRRRAEISPGEVRGRDQGPEPGFGERASDQRGCRCLEGSGEHAGQAQRVLRL